jgi:hypothetical protein
MPNPVLELRWGIKASFREYVDEIEGSSQEMLPGAGRADAGTYVFDFSPEASTWDNDRRPKVLAYQGAVRFLAYGGMLNVLIRDPRIEFDDQSTRLTIADPAAQGQRLHLATLKPDAPTMNDGVLIWTSVSARLAAGGMRVFDGVYGPGSELDHLRFTAAPPIYRLVD